MQKEYILDPITGKSKINRGELPQYWVEDHHEPIIPLEEFRKVEEERKRRREGGAFLNPAINTSALTSKIVCVHCNKVFHRATRVQRRGDVKTWICSNRKTGKKCNCGTGEMDEETLKKIIMEILEIYVWNEDIVREKLTRIDVLKKEKLVFHLYNDEVIEVPYSRVRRRNG